MGKFSAITDVPKIKVRGELPPTKRIPVKTKKTTEVAETPIKTEPTINYSSVVSDTEKDYGLHAGDLGYGKDTALGGMDGSRSTGHFGTGVYFLSKDKKDDFSFERKNRSIYAVDFSQFKLAKPRTARDAKDLHEGLRAVQYLVSRKGNFQDFDWAEHENKLLLRKASFKLYLSLLKKADGSFIDEEELKKTIVKLVEETAPLKKKVGFDREIYEESGSTRVMRALGYEGVDVRHIPEANNTTYGSVIYGQSLKDKGVRVEQ